MFFLNSNIKFSLVFIPQFILTSTELPLTQQIKEAFCSKLWVRAWRIAGSLFRFPDTSCNFPSKLSFWTMLLPTSTGVPGVSTRQELSVLDIENTKHKACLALAQSGHHSVLLESVSWGSFTHSGVIFLFCAVCQHHPNTHLPLIQSKYGRWFLPWVKRYYLYNHRF